MGSAAFIERGGADRGIEERLRELAALARRERVLLELVGSQRLLELRLARARRSFTFSLV
jgi:hypothetical protein